MTYKPPMWEPDCRHTGAMVVKHLKRRGGVEYICDPDRQGCGSKVLPRKHKKRKAGEE